MKPVMFLTKGDCLAALKLFGARLGMPEDVCSDNSTSFIRTNGEQELRQALATKKFQHLKSVFSCENSITWLTIPPRTSKIRGLWEAAVKSRKRHMHRSNGRTKLKIGNFATRLTQVEAILNSRPIALVSDDANYALALTLGHFLTGRPITALPEQSFVTVEKATTLS